MPQQTCLNSTNYEIKSGTALIDATTYQISHGLTYFDGVNYNINLSPPLYIGQQWIFDTPGEYKWRCPADGTYAIQMHGGGGGGGRSYNTTPGAGGVYTNTGGGGGGSGGVIPYLFLSQYLNYTLEIGAGGSLRQAGEDSSIISHFPEGDLNFSFICSGGQPGKDASSAKGGQGGEPGIITGTLDVEIIHTSTPGNDGRTAAGITVMAAIPNALGNYSVGGRGLDTPPILDNVQWYDEYGNGGNGATSYSLLDQPPPGDNGAIIITYLG